MYSIEQYTHIGRRVHSGKSDEMNCLAGKHDTTNLESMNKHTVQGGKALHRFA